MGSGSFWDVAVKKEMARLEWVPVAPILRKKVTHR